VQDYVLVGIGYALLAHLVPSGLTAPMLAITSYAMAATGPEAFVEGIFLMVGCVIPAIGAELQGRAWWAGRVRPATARPAPASA
jgi:hypothetical protein